MPKRIGNIAHTMQQSDFIRRCMVDSAKNRMADKTTAPALARMDWCIWWVQQRLALWDWVPSSPIHTTRTEPGCGKERQIDYVPYWPDTVMHWVLIKSVESRLIGKLDPYCVAGVPGRGPHKTAKKMREWMECDPRGTKYGAELDLHHAFENTDREIVKWSLRQYVKDTTWLWLADTIIDSFSPGLPIGYYTSHWLENLTLTPFDRYLRAQPGVAHYYRYVDNIHLYGPNKRALHRAMDAAMDWLCAAGFAVNGNRQVYRLDYIARDGKHRGRGADGLGFVVFRDHTILRKPITKRLRRLCCKIAARRGGIPTAKQARAAACRIGQLKWADAGNFRRKWVDSVVQYKLIRSVIKNADCDKQ